MILKCFQKSDVFIFLEISNICKTFPQKQIKGFISLPCSEYTEEKVTANLKAAAEPKRKRDNNFYTKQPFI